MVCDEGGVGEDDDDDAAAAKQMIEFVSFNELVMKADQNDKSYFYISLIIR